MKKWIIGMDEVGRGALAGPVVVAVARIEGSNWLPKRGDLATLKDSKKLSASQREQWFDYVTHHPNISFAIARVYPRQIEKHNISGAANLAALRAYKKLVADLSIVTAIVTANTPAKIFLDGGLFLGNGILKRENPYRAKTMVKADETISAVAIASIIAKVHRDRFMVKLAKQYPQYGFEIHKGYGTKQHRQALKRQGISKVHRRSFMLKIG
jgi:ribonuclease HII